MTTETTTKPDADSTAAAPKPTYVEAMESLTGYEELAVTGRFEAPIDDLPLSMQLRALVFVEHLRAGKEKKDAFAAAMGMTVREFNDHFSNPDNEAHADAEGNGEQSE